MNESSVFVDESGDFGEYDYHAPYYIIFLMFHNDNVKIKFTKMDRLFFTNLDRII